MWVYVAVLVVAILVEVAGRREAHGPEERKKEDVVELDFLLEFAAPDVAVAFEN